MPQLTSIIHSFPTANNANVLGVVKRPRGRHSKVSKITRPEWPTNQRPAISNRRAVSRSHKVGLWPQIFGVLSYQEPIVSKAVTPRLQSALFRNSYTATPCIQSHSCILHLIPYIPIQNDCSYNLLRSLRWQLRLRFSGQVFVWEAIGVELQLREGSHGEHRCGCEVLVS